MPNKLKATLIAAAVAGALAIAGTAIAGAGGENDKPITGPALDRASAAALDYTGGGRVTDSEVGDEEGYYEIEVSRGASQVDVHLDRDFDVLGQQADGDGGSDREGSNGD